MIKFISKSGIMILLGLFLIAAYVEGISMEPLEVLNNENPDIPWKSSQNNGESTKSAGRDLSGKGLITQSSSNWQSDEQKHKAQDHGEEELDALPLTVISSSRFNVVGNTLFKEAFNSIPEQAEICC